MQLIYIDSAYTDYLSKVDNRVSWNKNVIYQRPYIGVLLNIQDKKYFAPLTSSAKNHRLADRPMKESVTFYPIDECRLGGINLNNMIPVIDGVYWLVDLNLDSSDNRVQRNKKMLLRKTIRFLRKNKDSIIIKAKFLYNLYCDDELYGNRKKITCDFRKLEEAANKYKRGKNEN